MDAYQLLFNDSFKRLCRTLKVKLNAMRHCQHKLDKEMQEEATRKMKDFLKEQLLSKKFTIFQN